MSKQQLLKVLICMRFKAYKICLTTVLISNNHDSFQTKHLKQHRNLKVDFKYQIETGHKIAKICQKFEINKCLVLNIFMHFP